MKTTFTSTTRYHHPKRNQFILSALLAAILIAGVVHASPANSDAVKAPNQSSYRVVLPGPSPWIVLPEGPVNDGTIYCCDADGCTIVDSFSDCLPDDIVMVCDPDGICIPVGQLQLPNKKAE
jgi:hypothetical protein